MTGASLNALKSVVAGNETYRKASYWHQLDNMLEMDGKEYSYTTVVRDWWGLRYNNSNPDMMRVQNRLVKTKKYEYSKYSPVNLGYRRVNMRSYK